MEIGDTITLVPTEGGYQKEKVATIEKITPKRLTVRIEDRLTLTTFDRDTGFGATKLDRAFPNYKLKG